MCPCTVSFARCARHQTSPRVILPRVPNRTFHDYFVTHLPTSSLHPDARSAAGPGHQLPRAASKPHTPGSGPSPAPLLGVSRDTTVVRIPLRNAKHHFGVSISRGQRPYNEDAYQAGVIELPAFAKKVPVSLARRNAPVNASRQDPLSAYREKRRLEQEGQKKDESSREATAPDNASGDPQVFYFGVFDGHGGAECSAFLTEQLHQYIEDTSRSFELKSTLQIGSEDTSLTLNNNDIETETRSTKSDPNQPQDSNLDRVEKLESSLVKGWQNLVGGYFRRFRPALFTQSDSKVADISTVLTYAFLKADFDFIRAQAQYKLKEEDTVLSDGPLNGDDSLDPQDEPPASINDKIKVSKSFAGGSTCSVALVSTPTPTPFWHPSTSASLVVAHVGDSRILLCRTSDGEAVPMTTNHHPSTPGEDTRLRRYSGSIVTDSFGEERISGLANTRAFGDMGSKRVGVSAEPEITRLDMSPAQFSFIVLMSDGITGSLSDQEICDIVKEAKTPEQGAKDVVNFATEVSKDGDNATCVVVRMGGWERRSEGGVGSLGTKESRDFRKQEASNPRSRRT